MLRNAFCIFLWQTIWVKYICIYLCLYNHYMTVFPVPFVTSYALSYVFYLSDTSNDAPSSQSGYISMLTNCRLNIWNKKYINNLAQPDPRCCTVRRAHWYVSRRPCVCAAAVSSMGRPLCQLLLPLKPQHTVPWCVVLLLWCTRTWSEACAVERNGTVLLCRSCGHEVATEADIKSVHSPMALSHRNDSLLLGDKLVHIQLLQNPHGHQFEVITFRAADVAKRWPAEGSFSWFPGFAWTLASCPQCGAHLGKSEEPHHTGGLERGSRAIYNDPSVAFRMGLPAQRVAPHRPGQQVWWLRVDVSGFDHRPPVEGRLCSETPDPQVLLQLTATPGYAASLNRFN